MKFLLIIFLLVLSTQVNASCRYEARIRLGLVWQTISIKSEKPLTRNQVIGRLSKKYRFHDVGSIDKVKGCE